MGTDAATLEDTRKFVMAFESPIAVILAVQTRQIIRIYLERDPYHPDCLRAPNVIEIEPRRGGGGGPRRVRRYIVVCMPTTSGARAPVTAARTCCATRPPRRSMAS